MYQVSFYCFNFLYIGLTLILTIIFSLINFRAFTLAEHASEQRRQHRQQINELNPSSSSSEESNTEEDPSENSASEADSEVYGFLQPVNARQRRALLKAAGVRKIDTTEKDECRLIRLSREVCGCSCRGYCDPDTCECSQNGIKCQVDRLKPQEFPCGCTRDGCGNVNGRVEFNPARVKTHFIHTIMRLGLEKKPDSTPDQQPHMLTGYHSSKWMPPHVRTHCDYNSYMYNNSLTITPHYSSKVSTGGQQNGVESLDLHYAYRDDYAATAGTTMQQNGDSNSFNGQGTNEYYLNYNYIANGTQYHSPYHTMHHTNNTVQQPQQYPHTYPQAHSYMGENNLYANSHYVSTQNGFSGPPVHNGFTSLPRLNGYLEQPQMTISDLVTNNTDSNVNSCSNIVAPTPIYATPTENGADTLDSLTRCRESNDKESKNNNNENTENQNSSSNGESNENLSDIIKKSIVETVTA